MYIFNQIYFYTATPWTAYTILSLYGFVSRKNQIKKSKPPSVKWYYLLKEW